MVNFNKIKDTKKKIIIKFLKKKIKLQVHYIPINTQPYYKKKYKNDLKKFKNTNFFYERCISLPIYYDLNNIQLRYIAKVCKKIFKIK